MARGDADQVAQEYYNYIRKKEASNRTRQLKPYKTTRVGTAVPGTAESPGLRFAIPSVRERKPSNARNEQAPVASPQNQPDRPPRVDPEQQAQANNSGSSVFDWDIEDAKTGDDDNVVYKALTVAKDLFVRAGDKVKSSSTKLINEARAKTQSGTTAGHDHDNKDDNAAQAGGMGVSGSLLDQDADDALYEYEYTPNYELIEKSENSSSAARSRRNAVFELDDDYQLNTEIPNRRPYADNHPPNRVVRGLYMPQNRTTARQEGEPLMSEQQENNAMLTDILGEGIDEKPGLTRRERRALLEANEKLPIKNGVISDSKKTNERFSDDAPTVEFTPIRVHPDDKNQAAAQERKPAPVLKTPDKPRRASIKITEEIKERDSDRQRIDTRAKPEREDPLRRDSKRRVYDDDDDYDDDDYDEFDDYDDDDDDEYYSFGKRFLGFAKIILILVLVVLLTALALQFAESNGSVSLDNVRGLPIPYIDMIFPKPSAAPSPQAMTQDDAGQLPAENQNDDLNAAG